MALIYALKKYPQLLEEESLQHHDAELERMMKEFKKIKEFEEIIRRQKAAIRKSARIMGLRKIEYTETDLHQQN